MPNKIYFFFVYVFFLLCMKSMRIKLYDVKGVICLVLKFYCFLVCRFLVSVCYSKAKVAAACAGIVYFLSYVPYMYIAIREEAAGDRISAFVKSLAVRGLELKFFIRTI